MVSDGIYSVGVPIGIESVVVLFGVAHSEVVLRMHLFEVVGHDVSLGYYPLELVHDYDCLDLWIHPDLGVALYN